MIKKIFIQNYKIFEHFDLELNSELNIIVGDNEVGKSTILEAINLGLTKRLNGRFIEHELTPYLFNKKCVDEYLKSIKEGKPKQLPEIIIELYLDDDPELASLRGSMNSKKEDCIGIKIEIVFDEDYKEEYENLIKKPSNEIRLIPAEYYKVQWYSFANNAITLRSCPVRLSYIDATTIRLQSGTDYYLQDECDQKLNGLISKRLEKIYGSIFIDELQDFAGYDLDLLEILFHSDINIFAVGDPRQATFSTNNAQKNRQHRKSNIYLWLKEKERKNKLTIKEMNDSHRCNQHICDFADKLFPDLPQTVSNNTSLTGHDGIFYVLSNEVDVYISTHNPAILRYNKNTDTYGLRASNIGMVKGRTFNRVLIFPTKPMLEYLKTNDLSRAGDKSKLYVAVTRAKHSVAFVVDDKSLIEKIGNKN